MSDSDKTLAQLRQNNINWATQIKKSEPAFFEKLGQQQNPQYLWIGCSDSRVPANQIVGLLPGEIFVHRNVANLVVHSDLNCLSVIQYAVEVLKVKHIIVCGHYGCGGVDAVLAGRELGLIDNWLRYVGDTARDHRDFLNIIPAAAKLDALCELNVISQVRNVALTTILGNAWARGQKVSLHGWIYAIRDGLLQDLQMTISDSESAEVIYRQSVSGVANRYQDPQASLRDRTNIL